jgi:mannose-6-phosphate isomerase-like protein (cupin superfamily)
MSSDKHLVLDPDVHEKLISRKRASHVTVREIGNTVLRSALSHPPLSDAIARKLIGEGKLSEADYVKARADAIRELDDCRQQVSDLLDPTDRGTLISGSWEIAMGRSGSKPHYQVLDCWAIDGSQNPLPLHSHEESTEYFIVLQGRILVSMEEGSIVEEGACFRILPGEPHSVTPLTADTRVIAVCSPPDPSLAGSAPTDSP